MNMDHVNLILEDSSSDDEEMNMITVPLHSVSILAQDDEEDISVVIRDVVVPILNAVERVNHVRVANYIEDVVHMYIDRDFVMHFRLSRTLTYELINCFNASPTFLSLQVPGGYEPITAEKHILSYLWFIGHESAGYRDVADRFNIALSALHKIISRVTSFLLSLAPQVIKFPTQERRTQIKEFYLRQKRFPGVVGSIDGSHIRIDKPVEDHDSYINRKQFFSIQLQGVVDHTRKFLDVFVGYPGSVHDARVFRESYLFNRLNDFCGDGYLIGDSAYPCLQHLLVPYRDNGHLTKAQIQFNRRLSSCRVHVENAFADLKQRFRQLYHFKLRNIVRMVTIIHACCVLHNLANADDMQFFEEPLIDDLPDNEAVNPQIDYQNILTEHNQPGKDLRDEVCRQLAVQQ